MGSFIQRAELVERQTREATEAARRMVAEELVTILAHDLGNYLTPLITRVYLLRARAERDNRPRDVEEAEGLGRSLRRLQRLIADLLDVARIEEGMFALDPRPVNLPELAREISAAMQAPGLAVAVQAPAELVVEADPDRIRQALQNLLANAQRHAPGSPVVLEVRHDARRDADYAVIDVRDSGPGVAPELLPRLGQRFVRGSRGKGLGIGLYLARSIAEAHGGTLEVASPPGEGATFRLMVPLRGEAGARENQGVGARSPRQEPRASPRY